MATRYYNLENEAKAYLKACNDRGIVNQTNIKTLNDFVINRKTRNLNASFLANSPIVLNGLVLWLDAGVSDSYPAGDTVWKDLAGSNNGTLVNGVGYNSANAGSLVFDGSNDYINCGSFFTFNFFTIALWVRPEPTQVFNADIFDNNHTGQRNFVCQQNGSNTNQYAFGCANATNSSSTSFFTLAANTWHYLTFTWNNSITSAYINGIFHSSGSPANPINYSLQNLRLGGWYAGGRNWNGRMSNFIAYNRVLPLTEILQNYNAQRSRFGL